MAHNEFFGQDLTWLQGLRTTLRSAVESVIAGRSVSYGGKSITMEDLPTLKATLREVEDEIRRQEGTEELEGRVIIADFSG